MKYEKDQQVWVKDGVELDLAGRAVTERGGTVLRRVFLTTFDGEGFVGVPGSNVLWELIMADGDHQVFRESQFEPVEEFKVGDRVEVGKDAIYNPGQTGVIVQCSLPTQEYQIRVGSMVEWYRRKLLTKLPPEPEWRIEDMTGGAELLWGQKRAAHIVRCKGVFDYQTYAILEDIPEEWALKLQERAAQVALGELGKRGSEAKREAREGELRKLRERIIYDETENGFRATGNGIKYLYPGEGEKAKESNLERAARTLAGFQEVVRREKRICQLEKEAENE